MSRLPHLAGAGGDRLRIEEALPVVFPEQPRRLRHERWLNIAFRTAHLLTSGILLGGHVFDVGPDRLATWLVLTVLTGSALVLLELYRSGRWLFMLQGLLVMLKVALTALVLVWWEARVVLLSAVVLLGGLGSHMPSRLRHYSVLHGREITYPKAEGRAGRRESRA
jgi:hypothetical protein